MAFRDRKQGRTTTPRTHQQVPAATDVTVEAPDLRDFDSLLQHPDMEVDSYEHESDNSHTQDTIAGDETPSEYLPPIPKPFTISF